MFSLLVVVAPLGNAGDSGDVRDDVGEAIGAIAALEWL